MTPHAPFSHKWRRLTGLITKEARQVLRDPSSVLIAGVMPLLLLFLFGYGVTFDPRELDVALVVEQQSSETASFQAALENSTLFEVEVGRDRRLFERDLSLGKIGGLIVLPADFSAKAFRADSAPVQVIVDGSDPNTAYLVSGYVELLWGNWLEQEWIRRGRPALPPSVQLQPQVWFNPEISSRNYLVPGSVAIILTTIGALLTALVVAREWERGTMEALLATPVGIFELLIGKLVPYYLLGMGSMALAVITAIWLFGVPFRGSLGVLVLSSSLFMLCSLGQGLLISTLTRNQLVAAQASVLTAFLPAFYFSNFVFEIDSMPLALRLISYAVPARYYVSTLQTEFLAGDVWNVILADLAGLGLFAVIVFGLTALTTRTRLE